MEEIANKETYRSYLFFWSGQLVSLLGSSVVYFVITWWITVEYQSALFLSIASFLFILPMTISMPIAGVFSDRINRKTLILIADSSQAFVTFILILLFLFGIANIWLIFIFISLRAIFQAFHLPTVNAIIPTMVPKEKLTRINGINFMFTGVVQLVAPFIAAVLWMLMTIEIILWVDVITFFIALVPLLLISIPSINQINNISGKEQNPKKNSFIKEFRLGVRTLKLVPGLITMIILSLLLNFLIRPIDTLMSLYINVNHGGGPGHLALTLAFFQGGMIFGALITSIKKEWNNKIRVIFISMIIALIGYIIFGIAPTGSYIILIIGGVIMGINLPIINALYQTFIQTTVPADKIGRVTSIDHTFSMSISPLGTILCGPLAEIIGIPSLFFYSGLIGIICTMSFWSFTNIRKVDIDSKSELKKVYDEIGNLAI